MTVYVSVEDEESVLNEVREFEESIAPDVDSPWYSAEISSYGDEPSEVMNFTGVIRPDIVTGHHEDLPGAYNSHREYEGVEIPFDISFTEHQLDREKIESDLQDAQSVLAGQDLSTTFYINDTAPEGPFENPEYALSSIAGAEILMEVQGSEAKAVFEYIGDFAPSDQTALVADEEESELMRDVVDSLDAVITAD